MPEQLAPPQPRDVDLERIPFLFDQEPNDAAAVKLVVSTFGVYESQRRSHEERWKVAENLYHGVVEKRKWEGTEVERASLPVMISYDQVESAFPILTEELFVHYPTFFDVLPRGNTTPQEAAQQRDQLADYLETPTDETGVTGIVHLGICLKQSLIYGDGMVEVVWDSELKQPVVEFADLRDVYFDLSTPAPLIDLSPSLIQRKLLTVEELVRIRGTKGVDIPSDEILNFLAKASWISSGDMVRRAAARAAKETIPLGMLRTDPQHQQIEVLVYWTRDRLIWVLGRVWCVVNEKNPYGFIPYCKAPFNFVPGRPYGMSLPDVLEGEQKYAQGIRNARLDNLALALRPPRKRIAGTPVNPSKIAWRPGLIDEVPTEGSVEVLPVQNVTADAYREEQLIHAQAAKRTGINDMVQSGVPTPSNANRNATGVMAQQQSVNQRLRSAVKNFEDFLIVPMLYKMQKMMSKFGGANMPEVRFKMEAASRMISRDKMAMFLGPVSQMLFNEVVMKQANTQGQTIDFDEWQRFFQDATATARSYKFFRSMKPEEKQAMMQPDAKMMLEMQKAQMESQTRLQMGKMKSETELETTKMETGARLTETGERSARELSKVLAGSINGEVDRRAATKSSKSSNK